MSGQKIDIASSKRCKPGNDRIRFRGSIGNSDLNAILKRLA